MKTLARCAMMLFSVAACSFSQTSIFGRFVGMDGASLDLTQVVLKDGTGDTAYCHVPISRSGSFSLSTSRSGTLLADISCPGYKPVQAALLLDQPTTDSVEVMLSPLPRPDGESRLVFRDSTSILARFALLHMKSAARFARYQNEHHKFLLNGGDERDFRRVLSIDWKEEAERVATALSHEKEPILRQELIMQYMELNGLMGYQSPSRDSIKKWILEIPPTSPAWVYHSNLSSVGAFLHRDGLEYLNKVIAEHPNRYLRANLLYGKAIEAMGTKDVKKFEEIMTELMSSYSDTRWAAKALLLRPKLRIGDPVPPFNFQSIDDTMRYFSAEKMLGRVYLIDFWATWCGPCVREMPYLHKAYERFAKYGFTILSISRDKSMTDVSTYRKRKWRMPWLNAFVGYQANHPVISAFGVWSIPYALLVDSKGTIVAMNDVLHGDELERTIEKYVGK